MRIRRELRLVGAVLMLWRGGATIAQEQQVNLPSIRDNTLYEDEMGFTSNGAGQHMFVGTTNNGVLRRALVAFDIARNIPAGSTIQNVVLTLNMSKTAGPPIDIDLRVATRDWGEGTSAADGDEGRGDMATPGDATWLHTFFDTQFWSFEGGDFLPTPSARTTVGQLGTYTWSGSGMVADVQRWLDQSCANFGWVLIATDTEYLRKTAKRFDTKENSDSTVRPVLSVTYVQAGASPQAR